ncbi:SRPBCC family protein [Rhodococcus oryzae]|uniref:SRPBCC family protein n=1 Tax=Rhodococcus oryzae TaxID=2571143 RepID=UPI0037A85CDD
MTSTGQATVDEGRYTVSRTVVINATRDRVWQALTDPEHIAKWFGQRAVIDSLTVGARGVFSWDEHGDMPLEIIEVDAPDRFGYRWGHLGEPDLSRGTDVRFTLRELGGSTELTVVETGFDRVSDVESERRDALEGNRQGWNAELDELVAYLEAKAA